MRRLLPWIIGPTILLFVGYAVVMIVMHPGFIYPFAQDEFNRDGYDRVEVDVPGANPLVVEMAKGESGAPVVVYFMGNLGALDHFAAMLDHHRSKGRTIVAMTYRGGGGQAGTPSEVQLKRDAAALMKALPDLVDADAGPVVVQGYSLGTGLALHVAAHSDVSAVLLVAPYARLCELMSKASYLPACWLPGVQKWRSIDEIDGIRVPVRILHGELDQLIPPEHSDRLGERLAENGSRVTRLLIPGGAHSDLMSRPKYLPAIDRFLDRIAGL